MVCLKCNTGWTILPHEKYCGYCGCKIFEFLMQWKENPRFYINDETDIRDLPIFVENTGAAPIKFQPIQIQPGDALKPPASNEPFEIKPGQSYVIETHVDPKKLTNQPEKITLHIQGASPTLEREKSLTLQALPLPDFKLTPSRAVLRYPKSKKTEAIDFRVEFYQNQFDIESIEFSQHWIKAIDHSEAPRNVRLEIDCNKLEEGHNLETLRFKLRGPSQPIEKQIEVQAEIMPEPAKLFVPEVSLEVIQDRVKTHRLKLQNKGEQPLMIQNIVCGDPSNLVQLPNLEYPINIEGEGHQNIEVLISNDGLEPGTYAINFTITSNYEADPQYQYNLNVTVKQREEYPYYLAIDFGTTNSCCAYIDKSYNMKLLPLDIKANPSEIMPSSIIYHSHPIEGKTYNIGYDAETNRTSVRDGPYYISSVKRWLGFRWHRKFPNNQKYQPLDVFSHILKHIINEAEDYLEQQSVGSKITKCVIAHPTMFTPEQQEDLKQAFENIGISELILIDEASAASMGIILDSYNILQENYRLLVYDFGGGTIDIVLSQVRIDGSDIAIDPIARDGERQYGGDDVTQAIVDFVLKEYSGRIDRKNPGLNFDIPYFEPGRILQPTGNQEIDNATGGNARILYEQAEKMKKELNTKSETEFDSSKPASALTVVVGGRVDNLQNLIEENDYSIKLSAQKFQSFIEPALKKTFEKIDAMIADNDAHLPNTVVLAGQSSKMKLVKKLMDAHFREKYQTDIEIHLDENPKTCVVMGAAQYGLTHSLPAEEGGIQVVQLANKTLSRLGITRQKLGRPVFGEIIPKGKLIPQQSVNTTDCRLQSRSPFIEVHEHFGADDDIQNASLIAGYTLNLPRNVSTGALREARLKMAVKSNREIELTALVGDNEYTFTVQKEIPEFVDSIY